MNFKKGFTLIEMLVVISVLSVVGVMILTIFTRTLRGGNKSQIIETIKQNGQSVLENMDKTVRNADSVICPKVASPTSDTLVVIRDGAYTRFKFSPPTTSNNGKIQQDFPVQPATGDKSQIKTFLENNICTDPIGTDSTISPQTLTDTNSQTGVSVDCVAVNGTPNCATKPIFKRDKSAGFKDQVTIKFDIGHGVLAPAAVAGQIDPVSFQTTINLR